MSMAPCVFMHSVNHAGVRNQVQVLSTGEGQIICQMLPSYHELLIKVHADL